MHSRTNLCRFFRCATLVSVTVLMIACGGDDEPSGDNPQPQPEQQTINNNRNDATANPYLALLEMPRVKGGTSEVITHVVGNKEVNYSIEWDHQLRAQRWTCYELNKRNFQTNGNNRNSLWPNGDPWSYDPDAPMAEQQATFNELSKSTYPGTTDIYSKGHICPSGDRLYTKDANEQTYFMTNIMPMVNSFNAGIWNKLETKVRGWVGNATSRVWNNNFDALYVCKGGTIDRADQILGYTVASASVNGETTPHPGNHIVPRYFFMALLGKKDNQYKALGFWVEHLNEDHSGDMPGNYVVNIDELERLTGIDFFCNLPDEVEEAVESTPTATVKNEWGLR